MSEHIPVLLDEAIESLSIKQDGTYVDCTTGRGGHSSEILKRIPKGRLICFDQDEEAIRQSKPRLEAIGSNVTFVKANFKDLKAELAALGIHEVDGILADLGVSSPQFDEGERGFSYQHDGPLDMRMDLDNPLTAKEVVNAYSLQELTRIFRDYGEDKDAYGVARAIVKARENHPIETTLELVSIIKSGKPFHSLAKKGHPAKQIFQALRIEVNHEEEALQALLEDGPSLLKQDGRLAIITFMSLDDRLVKNRFKELSVVEGSREDVNLLPSQIEEKPFALYSKKPIAPSEAELQANHRAASAKLRTLIKK